MAELGLIAPVGLQGAATLAAIVKDLADDRLPPVARLALTTLVGAIESISQQIGILDRAIHAAHRASETSRRLESIPGVGPVTASAIMATVGSCENFKSARGFAAWLCLARIGELSPSALNSTAWPFSSALRPSSRSNGHGTSNSRASWSMTEGQYEADFA